MLVRSITGRIVGFGSMLSKMLESRPFSMVFAESTVRSPTFCVLCSIWPLLKMKEGCKLPSHIQFSLVHFASIKLPTPIITAPIIAIIFSISSRDNPGFHKRN